MKNTKTTTGLFLILGMVMCLCLWIPAPSKAASSGTCGNYINWELNSEGLLHISCSSYGSGSKEINPTAYDNSTTWRSRLSDVRNVQIDSGITGIGKESFKNCSNLQTVSVPATVTYIDQNAFDSCYNLTTISSLDGLTSMHPNAFDYCRPKIYASLGSSGAKYLSRQGFFFTDPDNEGKYIYFSSDMHFDKNSITGVRMNYRFSGELTKLDLLSVPTDTESFEIPEEVTSIGYWGASCFAGCSRLTSIIIPDHVQLIGSSTFENCTGLQSIELPAGLAYIDTYTFKGCTSLAEIDIPTTAESIGMSAFEGCTALSEIEFPENLRTIGDFAFMNCTGLEKISFSGNITKINGWAFKDCTNLKVINGLSTSTTTVARDAFEGCTSLPSIFGKWYAESREVDGFMLPWYYLYDHDISIEMVDFIDDNQAVLQEDYNSPSTASPFYYYLNGIYLGDYCISQLYDSAVVRHKKPNTEVYDFYYSYQLTNGKLIRTAMDGSITVFARNLTLHPTDKTIILPADLEEIEDEAFLNCTGIECFLVLASVTKIGNNPFPEGAVIICRYNSEMDKWAKEHGFDVEYEGSIVRD